MTTRLWSWRSVRLRVAVCIALALTIEGLMRSNLNMAMVCMLNETAFVDDRALRAINHSTKCEELRFGNEKVYKYNGDLIWTSQQRAVIFASFYAGGLIATLITERLNRCMGAKRLVLYGAIVNVLGTFATPTVASFFGPIPMVVLRFIMGFGQGLLWPCMSVLVGHWFPATEKSTALAIATTGNQLSVVIAMFATAELCQLPLFGGWPMAFHTYGVLGVLLCILWQIFVEDIPAHALGITDEEVQVITNSTVDDSTNWMQLLSSPVVWSIAGSAFAHNFITVGTVTYLPFYYKTVLNMSLTSNGILSALPFIFQFISKILYAGFADESKNRGWMSFTGVTKICNSSASLGLVVCFVLLCFCDCTHRLAAVVLVCLAMAFVSGYIPGYNTSVVSIAPSQTAAIASFSRIWAQIASSLSPYQIGALTKQVLWKIIFCDTVTPTKEEKTEKDELDL
uniref:MFS domain-containing protein n=1 Tax=Angiostrongylus cantonensis TaxID=6313 RepID=A0A158P6L8_ANGCA